MREQTQIRAVNVGSIYTVKAKLMQDFENVVDQALNKADQDGATQRKVETFLWKVIIPFCAVMMAHLLAVMCRRKSLTALKKRDLEVDGKRVLFRFDKDYWAELRTTFGKIVFPLFAFRVRTLGAEVTNTPAREIFPYQQYCRSSELCLEWEARLGSDHPFRQAQEALNYFTHGAVTIEDNTIAEHMVKVSELIEREDLYRTPAEIRQILQERATRDRENGKPILYMSSDAHALRRYVGETWDAQWKMTNGIRLWCEDRNTGEIIHLGGEYTWGDCKEVRDIFADLVAKDIVGADGDYGDGVVAQLAWLSDGMPWFEEHILPLFPQIKVILDVCHVLNRIAAYVRNVYGKKKKNAPKWYQEVTELITGHDGSAKEKSQTRKGHKKQHGGKRRPRHAHQRPSAQEDVDIDIVSLLLTLLSGEKLSKKAHTNARNKLVNYVLKNGYRMHYTSYRFDGYQIGSGAMESLHRNGSQIRLKLCGARWLKATSQAVMNLRMLRLAGNWEKFWSHPNFADRLADGLKKKKPANDNASSSFNKIQKKAV